MMTETQEHIGRVRTAVRNYFAAHAHELIDLSIMQQLDLEDHEHIVNIGVSIMCTKWKIGYEGGSFVQAVVANDLTRAFGCADSTNSKVMKFYVSLIYNLSYVE